jgi:sulfur-carrier protein adenylyltransferase/sulfurtransferase
VPGLAGVLQANEALLYLLGQGSSRVGRLLTFDLLGRCFREVKMGRDPKCPLCGQQPQIKDLRAENLFCGDPMSDEITPAEFKTQWDGGRRPTLIDVRRQDEWDTANLAEYGAKLIPLHEFEQRYQEIPKDADIVLHCKSGGRSGQAQRFLQSQGYTRVQNMAGGIGGWSDEVDSSKTKY